MDSVYAIHILDNGERTFTSVAMLAEDVKEYYPLISVTGGLVKKIYDVCATKYVEVDSLIFDTTEE